MTEKEAFDQTIDKFFDLWEAGKKPPWDMDDCPLCQFYYDPRKLTNQCGNCPFSQFTQPPYSFSSGCAVFALDTGWDNDTFGILCMLIVIRKYLYGGKLRLARRRNEKPKFLETPVGNH